MNGSLVDSRKTCPIKRPVGVLRIRAVDATVTLLFGHWSFVLKLLMV